MFLLKLVLSVLLVASVTTEVLSAPMDGRTSNGCYAVSGILRHYPASSAREVSCTTKIGITSASAFDASVTLPQCWKVTGSISGNHAGVITLSNDRSTAIFTPLSPFQPGETVSISLNTSCADGTVFQYAFSFSTTVQTLTLPTVGPVSANSVSELHLRKLFSPDSFPTPPDSLPLPPDSLPPPPPPPPPNLGGLPMLVDNNPTPGRIFLSIIPGPAPPMGLVIMDENSNILFNESINASDFELQPNGEMTYFGETCYYGIDSLGNNLRSYGCVNGISPDGHELLVYPNGGYTILGQSHTYQNMSAFGGSDSASIEGGVIQTFDSSGNLIFEWRGVDHYQVQDDIEPGDLTQSQIDFEHANSIDVDSEGNYLLSNRNLSEITKIDGKTGAIIWRFGGNHNQFKLVGDTLGISCQHFARWLKNGDMMCFDNGVYHPIPESRAVEYFLDTNTMTATLKWQFHHNPPVFSDVMGDAERLDNGNTFIGWGLQLTTTATEVDTNGNVVYEIQLPGGTASYRALKYPTPTLVITTGLFSSVSASSSQAALSLSVSETAGAYEVSATAAQMTSATISLCDETGRVVEQIYKGALSPDEQHFSISANALPTGAYFCILHSGEGEIVKPLVISH